MVKADSFIGRVLAVFARRSPGFRPPGRTWTGQDVLPATGSTLTPAQAQSDWPSMSKMAESWKSLPGSLRFVHRGALLELASLAEETGSRFFRIDHARYRHLDRLLSLTMALTRELTPASESRADLNLLIQARARVRSSDSTSDHDGRFELELADELRRMAEGLIDVGTLFGGADLSTVDLVDVDLTSISWDEHTRWPPGSSEYQQARQGTGRDSSAETGPQR